jgi:D-cysteine desulfhydrase
MHAITFPPRIPLAQLPTPLQALDRLSNELNGPRIWVKRDDLTGCAVSGNKIRKLEFTLARALEQNCDTLITCGGIQSNHCRATALLGAQLGLRVHLILRKDGEDAVLENIPDGNWFLDCLAGAQISMYDKKEYQLGLPELFTRWCNHYLDQGAKPYTIPTGASDGTGVWGYINCVAELIADFKAAGIKPGAVIHATGSGGTQAGLTAGAELYDLKPQVIGIAVCDSVDYFQNKVQSDIKQWQNRYEVPFTLDKTKIIVDDRYIGPGYAQATPEIYTVIRQLAALEGLVLDPVYTGKAFCGMLDKIRRGEFDAASDIVFIHTGGIFGLMADRKNALYAL